MMLHNYKLTVAYDGTAYSGWQIQPNGISIQEVLQNQLRTILRQDVVIIGSGRTDAGVHALAQVAHFHFSQPIDLYRVSGSLNSLLPPDIRVKEIIEAPIDFHAQHHAIAKTYHYNLCLDSTYSPFNRLYSYHVREKMDRSLLKEAAMLFIGTHDFTSFANEAHLGCASRDPVRTIIRLDVVEQEGGIRLEFEGDGFLYKMVRNITGTLLEVAAGKRRIDEIPEILTAKDRRRAGVAAPPHGLFLVHVQYPEEIAIFTTENTERKEERDERKSCR